MSDFYLSVKSTVDKIAVDIANGLGIEFVELDDTVNVEQMLSSPRDLVVYQLVGMDPNPQEPLWSVNFAIGAKTTTDAANYDLAAILAAIKSVVSKGKSFDVRDYSGAQAPTISDGYFYVVDARVDPQMFDGASGIRMLSVRAAGVHFGD